ncbi:MAG: hypothetical protein RL069_340, partial [Planctomycetota bacterium]
MRMLCARILAKHLLLKHLSTFDKTVTIPFSGAVSYAKVVER